MDHSVIDAVQQLHVQLVSLYDDLDSVENQDFFNSLCTSCKRIEEICEEDADVALGTILLKGSANYSVTHAINCAIVCEVIGKRLEWPFDKRLPLLAAALTMNLGMYALQNKLSEQSKALTLKEQKLVKSHTRKSFLLLREKGIANSTWLDTVLHHHECLDGSGYPDKLRQEKISMPCRVLALVDAYTAGIAPRKYRDGLAPDRVLNNLFKQKGKFDTRLGTVFLSGIGIYPPGTQIKLESGEMGVIVRSSQDVKKPVIKILTDASGQEVSGGEERESYEIDQVIPLGIKDPDVDLRQVWGGESDGNVPESMLSTLQQGPSEEELRQAFKVIQGVNIPAFPDVIFAIKAELAKEMPDIDSISELVSTDVALSGIAMKTVNSPIFGLKVKVTSIKHAITLLGLERFQSLVFSSALKRVMISDNAHPRMLRFWAEASAVGQCASYIADMMMDVDNEEAYMAGLFQACGTLLLSQKFPKYMEDVLPKAATKPFSVISYENKKYQTNHTLVGYVLARYWQVPEEVCLAIYHHHTQPLVNIQLQNVRVFSAILSVAISIVEWVCYGLKSETSERMEYQQQALNDLLITEQTLEEIQQDVTDMLLNEFQDLGV